MVVDVAGVDENNIVHVKVVGDCSVSMGLVVAALLG